MVDGQITLLILFRTYFTGYPKVRSKYLDKIKNPLRK